MGERLDMLGKTFVDYYYRLFDNDRASLSSLYQPTSLLTFEGQKIEGVDGISSKLNQLPFTKCEHVISSIDTHPSISTGGILVVVSGSLQLPEEDHMLRFSQMFQLLPTPQGTLYVQNDIFRLNYG